MRHNVTHNGRIIMHTTQHTQHHTTHTTHAHNRTTRPGAPSQIGAGQPTPLHSARLPDRNAECEAACGKEASSPETTGAAEQGRSSRATEREAAGGPGEPAGCRSDCDKDPSQTSPPPGRQVERFWAMPTGRAKEAPAGMVTAGSGPVSLIASISLCALARNTACLQ